MGPVLPSTSTIYMYLLLFQIDHSRLAVAQIGELPIMLNIEGCVVVTKLGFTAGEESMFYSKSYLHWPHLETISL